MILTLKKWILIIQNMQTNWKSGISCFQVNFYAFRYYNQNVGLQEQVPGNNGSILM